MRTFILLSLAALAGCAVQGGVQTHPVSGRVTYAGKPAPGVQVFFIPTTAPMMPEIPANPRGVTDADGRFTISTYGGNDGAAEGSYQVVLYWADESQREGETDRLLGWHDATRSKLKAEVKAGVNELPAFDLKEVTGPPGEIVGIPGRN